MKRHAIFVDAGYVFAQGSVSLLGRNTPRSQLKLDEAEFIKQLKALAQNQSSGIQLLRVYWYDGARNGPTVDHLAIAEMPDVKLRLGSLNSMGEQKEVDSLLVTDLIDLARNLFRLRKPLASEFTWLAWSPVAHLSPDLCAKKPIQCMRYQKPRLVNSCIRFPALVRSSRLTPPY